MDNRRKVGIIFAVLGLLLTCCLCPLALNSVLFIATSFGSPSDVFSLYGRLFPARITNALFVSNLVTAAQLACANILALAVLVLGALAVTRSRGSQLK